MSRPAFSERLKKLAKAEPKAPKAEMNQLSRLLRWVNAAQYVTFVALLVMPYCLYRASHDDATLAPDARHVWDIPLERGPHMFVPDERHFQWEMGLLATGALAAAYCGLIYWANQIRERVGLRST